MERDLGQLAAHLRLHRDGGVRFHVSDDIHVDGNIALRDRGDHHRNRSAVAGPAAASGTSRLRARIVAAAEGQQEGERQGCDSERARNVLAMFMEIAASRAGACTQDDERASSRPERLPGKHNYL